MAHLAVDAPAGRYHGSDWSRPRATVAADSKPAEHIIARLPDTADLKTLRDIAEACAAEGRLVHLLSADVTIVDTSWTAEAQALFNLFPDIVMLGGRIAVDNVIGAAEGYFGLGYGWDCPSLGRPLNDPGYFAQMWKPHSVNIVPLQHCVMRADFLAEALCGLRAAADFASPSSSPGWGRAAARGGKRVAYSPFFFARAQAITPAQPDDITRAAFLEAYGDLSPRKTTTLASPRTYARNNLLPRDGRRASCPGIGDAPTSRASLCRSIRRRPHCALCHEPPPAPVLPLLNLDQCLCTYTTGTLLGGGALRFSANLGDGRMDPS